MSGETTQIHATAIALDGRAALILGPPGAGKSDLALRCILQGAWIDGRHVLASLIADDQVIVDRSGGGLVARGPEPIQGRMEVRGLGIVDVPSVPAAEIGLAVELADIATIDRLPDPPPNWTLLGAEVPLIRVAPFEASAHLKVLLALARGLPAT
ncbi:MAG TPA: HPr kinase/phosphatase C-terminal domain-containing protein [Hyphomicrobiaceae bacterium]|nr:HPr kinase/phosphatase C-terminal domain-containing protein [Hyphomicrobiaceae bacterium]